MTSLQTVSLMLMENFSKFTSSKEKLLLFVSRGKELEPLEGVNARLGDRHMDKDGIALLWPYSVTLCKTGLIHAATRRAKQQK